MPRKTRSNIDIVTDIVRHAGARRERAAPAPGPAVSKIGPVGALRDALDVLSRTEIETAWRAGDAAAQSLGSGNLALRAEVAAYLLASILAKIAQGIAKGSHDRHGRTLSPQGLCNLHRNERLVLNYED
jgi:hypothetical protein